MLEAAVSETRLKQNSLQLLKARAVDMTLPPETRNKYSTLAKSAEADLAKSIQDTATFVSEAGLDVSPGTEGFHAMMEISNHGQNQ